MAKDILIVDDEGDIRALVADLLKDEGYQTRLAIDGPSALEAVTERRPSLVLLDIWLGDTRFDGLRVLETIKRDHPDLPIVMMSGHGTIETAVEAIKKGAYDFVEKPFKSDRLTLIVRRAIETARLRRENQDLKSKVDTNFGLVGVSHFMHQLHQTIEKVAPSGSRIFITGPSGVGKEVVARKIHQSSPRAKSGSFIILNCATMQAENFEKELFGEDTPQGQKTGILEQAHLGTLLLDEVTDMPPATQGKIARVLQEQAFCRVGGQKKVQVDVRVIATSSHNIKLAVQDGRLREDLFYRLNVVPILIKPLCERKEDIPALVDHFIDRACANTGHPRRPLSEEALAALQTYNWPGNVRQLRNVIDWVMIMVPNNAEDAHAPIGSEALPPEIISEVPSSPYWEGGRDVLKLPLKDAREAFERQYLLSQVSRFSGNISQTASFVGMERSALHRKLRLLGVDRGGGAAS